MLDGWIRGRIDGGLDAAGRRLARHISADGLTLIGLGFGLGAALAVGLGAFGLAAGLVALGRIADGLDGAVARARGNMRALGGYHDILADFIFYGALPLGFAFAGWPLPAAFLLFAFYVNGASFLAFAIFAEKFRITTQAQGKKAIYYSAGLMEGTETILFFLAMCVFPQSFPWLASVFGGLCLITAAGRFALARRVFVGLEG